MALAFGFASAFAGAWSSWGVGGVGAAVGAGSGVGAGGGSAAGGVTSWTEAIGCVTPGSLMVDRRPRRDVDGDRELPAADERHQQGALLRGGGHDRASEGRHAEALAARIVAKGKPVLNVEFSGNHGRPARCPADLGRTLAAPEGRRGR